MVHGALLCLSQDGACTNLFENLSENNLKGDLSNDTTENPPLFSLVNTFKDTAATESEVAEKSIWDPAKRGEKLGLVSRYKKKSSKIINDYLYLPFFLLIILCLHGKG